MTILPANKIAATLVGVVAFYVLFAVFSDLSEIQNHYEEMKLFFIVPILSLLVFSQFLRSLVQRYILTKLEIHISIKDSFLLFLSGLAMIVTPGGSGQIIKSHFLKQKFNQPIDKSFPLVFVERLIDLVVISVIIIITLFAVGVILESIFALILSFSLIVFLFASFRNKKLLKKTFRLLSKIKFLKNSFFDESQFVKSFDIISKPNVIFLMSSIILCSFMIEGFVVYFGFLSFGIELNFLKSIQLYYTSILFGALSFIPGGIGITEGSFAALLSKEIASLSLITAVVIFIRLTTLWFSASIGLLSAFFQMYKK